MVNAALDGRTAAFAIAKKLGIDKAVAGVMPQDKERHVAALQADGHKVAMIGDRLMWASGVAALEWCSF